MEDKPVRLLNVTAAVLATVFFSSFSVSTTNAQMTLDTVPGTNGSVIGGGTLTQPTTVVNTQSNILLPSWSSTNSSSVFQPQYNYNTLNGNNYSGGSINCGLSGYMELNRQNSSIQSNPFIQGLESNGFAGRVGLNISSQKCINHEKLVYTQEKWRAIHTIIQANQLTQNRCLEVMGEIALRQNISLDQLPKLRVLCENANESYKELLRIINEAQPKK
jgi:hypothetical protein